MLRVEGLRWSVWRGGGTKRAVEYISRRVSRSSSLCPPLSIALLVISNAEGAKSLEIGARPSRKTTCPDRVCWNPPFTSMFRRLLRFDFEDVTGRCKVCDWKWNIWSFEETTRQSKITKCTKTCWKRKHRRYKAKKRRILVRTLKIQFVSRVSRFIYFNYLISISFGGIPCGEAQSAIK